MKKLLFLIILIVISFLYTLPFFRSGYFATHDGEWAIVRLTEMQREIKDLQIPPRWADYLNHGYGYPLFSFTYPLPYYLGVIIRASGVGYTDTIKTLFVVSVFLSALFMYMLGKELVDNISAGIIASIFYIIAPFRLVDLYVRGSLGESLSLAIFPLLFLTGLKYVRQPNIFHLSLSSLSLTVLILTHNVMALLFFPIYITFLYVLIIAYHEDMRLYTWRYLLPMILLGIGLSLYFSLPAVIEKKYIALSQIPLSNIAENFIKLSDYLSSSWNYGINPSFQLGWFQILASVISVGSVIFSGVINRKKYLSLAAFMIVIIAILVFLAHPLSWNLWKLPPLSWLDFPWRLLGPLIFILALSSIFLSVHRSTKIIGIILIIMAVIFNLNFAKPSQFIDRPDTYYLTNDATTTSMDELMPVWVMDKPRDRYKDKVEIENGTATVFNLKYNSKNIEFTLNSQEKSNVKINSIFFPGWDYSLNGKKIEADYGQKDGLVRFEVGSGMYKVKGVFTETPVRLTADLISLVCLFLILILLIVSVIKKVNCHPDENRDLNIN